MDNFSLWLTLFSTLISGLAGALLSTVIFIRREKRRIKIDTLKKLAANRYHLHGDEFTRAINEIFVVYNDSPPVMQALGDFHRLATSPQRNAEAANDAIVRLFKAMCRHVGIRYEHFNDSFFLMPFNVRPPVVVPGVQQSPHSAPQPGQLG